MPGGAQCIRAARGEETHLKEVPLPSDFEFTPKMLSKSTGEEAERARIRLAAGQSRREAMRRGSECSVPPAAKEGANEPGHWLSSVQHRMDELTLHFIGCEAAVEAAWVGALAADADVSGVSGCRRRA